MLQFRGREGLLVFGRHSPPRNCTTMASVGDHARRQAAKLPSLSLDPPPMQATQEQLQQHKIPLQYRDYCAHLLIPLNEVRLQGLHCLVFLFLFRLFLRHCVVYCILFFLFFLCGTPYWCSSPLSVFSFQFWVQGSVCEVTDGSLGRRHIWKTGKQGVLR